MLLFDAVYINNGGGKVLLDYLIACLGGTEGKVVFLLDERVKGNHPPINGKEVIYIKGSLVQRIKFYRRHGHRFNKVLCFGNLAPHIKLKAKVFVYFHQFLFLKLPDDISLYHKIIFKVKRFIFYRFTFNANNWLVQSANIKNELVHQFSWIKQKQVFVMPFYPPLSYKGTVNRKQDSFVYISSGAEHKNHHNLLAAFKIFYDLNGCGELHLTVGDNFTSLNEAISLLKESGYPVINHGNVPREDLGFHYHNSKFLVYPSLAESFGLGIIEAIENGCIVVGADLPYLHAVCETPFIFDPSSATSIAAAMQLAFESENAVTKSLVKDHVGDIINLLN